MREIAAGIEAIYGAAAAASYVERAARGFGAALATPGSAMFSVAVAGGSVVGILLATPRDEAVEFSLIHVLAAHTGHGVEGSLVAAAVQHYREAGANTLLCEMLPYAPLQLEESFAALGFEAVRRGLYQASAPLLRARAEARRSANTGVASGIRPSDFAGVAHCIVSAYTNHPGRWLHPELGDAARARAMVLRIMSGAFGPVLPNYCRVHRADGAVDGALLGCEIAPGVGFVVQLVVLPEAQGRGIATQLLGEFATACLSAGVEDVALGVTLDNPARKLYEQLGFGLRCPITAYTWWRVRGEQHNAALKRNVAEDI